MEEMKESTSGEQNKFRVSGSELIWKVEKLLRRYVRFKDSDTALLLAVWILGTYTFRCFEYFGYMWITSATKRCGKTILLELIQHMGADATQRLSNITEAVLFRMANKGQTLIMDEIEQLQRSDRTAYGQVMSVLNNGFQRGGVVMRVEKKITSGGEPFDTVPHKVYCPKAFAGINSVIDTIEDRSFKIVMQRKLVGEKTERWRPHKLTPMFEKIREQMRQWTEANKSFFENVDETILDKIEPLRDADDRFKDISEPLYVLAWLADMERVENAVAQLPKESEADEKLFQALGVEPLTEVDRRKLSVELARQKGELILPRLAEVLRRMAQEKNGMEAMEPITAFIPWMEERLKVSGQTRVFVPTDDLLKAKNEADNDIWEFERGGSKALSSYLGKLGLKPAKNSQKQKRGYWIEQKWLEGQKGAYGTLIDASDPSYVSETQ